MKKLLTVLRRLMAAPLCLVAMTAAAQAPQPPEVAARTYLLVDVTANQILAAKDIDVPVEPASLTKLMTAYLVFRRAQGEENRSQTDAAGERARLEDAGLAHVHRPQDEGAGRRPASRA